MTPDQINALAWQKQNGLLPAIVQDADSLQVVMLGYMNREALESTLASGRVCFFSRSKNRLWTKGESSGHFLQLLSVQTDCDSDALLVLAHPNGPTCHLQRSSCFADAPANFLTMLEKRIAGRKNADPATSYSKRLMDSGLDKVAQKVGEEAVETVIAALVQGREATLNESADLLYHLLVLLQCKDLTLAEVLAVLEKR
jgi:phosphoribosyl-AMP cyclohydrolase / phosphoribosyl-ATP pyrophosphohydrolase